MIKIITANVIPPNVPSSRKSCTGQQNIMQNSIKQNKNCCEPAKK